MFNLEELCKNAHEARLKVGIMDTDLKNQILEDAADALVRHEEEILKANAIDVKNGEENHMSAGLLDRLRLNHDRIADMACLECAVGGKLMVELQERCVGILM